MKRVKGKRDIHRRGGPTKEELKALNKEHKFIWCKVSYHPSNPGKAWVVIPGHKSTDKSKYRYFRTRESAIDGAFCVDIAIEDLTTPEERDRLTEQFPHEALEDMEFAETTGEPNQKFCSLCNKSVGLFYPPQIQPSNEFYGVYFCTDDHSQTADNIFILAQQVWQGTRDKRLLDERLTEVKRKGWNNPIDIFSWKI